jgi:hypothetical protein
MTYHAVPSTSSASALSIENQRCSGTARPLSKAAWSGAIGHCGIGGGRPVRAGRPKLPNSTAMPGIVKHCDLVANPVGDEPVLAPSASIEPSLCRANSCPGQFVTRHFALTGDASSADARLWRPRAPGAAAKRSGVEAGRARGTGLGVRPALSMG